jgi:hypothetical protein
VFQLIDAHSEFMSVTGQYRSIDCARRSPAYDRKGIARAGSNFPDRFQNTHLVSTPGATTWQNQRCGCFVHVSPHIASVSRLEDH